MPSQAPIVSAVPFLGLSLFWFRLASGNCIQAAMGIWRNCRANLYVVVPFGHIHIEGQVRPSQQSGWLGPGVFRSYVGWPHSWRS